MSLSKSPLKFLLYVLIVFGFLTIGTELFRIVKITIDIDESLQIILEDSIELAVNDDFRRDHVTILVDGACQNDFYTMLRDKYNLDNTLTPIGDSYFASPFVIESFDVKVGEYDIDVVKQRAYQKDNPRARVRGYVEVKPMVLGVNTNIKIPFDIYAENKRTD